MDHESRAIQDTFSRITRDASLIAVDVAWFMGDRRSDSCVTSVRL
jgi:hypothetical protein